MLEREIAGGTAGLVAIADSKDPETAWEVPSATFSSVGPQELFMPSYWEP
jgi:hypothetical protein